jgi:signal transduction histidine kinase
MNIDLYQNKINAPDIGLSPEASHYVIHSLFAYTKSVMLFIDTDNRILFYNKPASDCSILLFGRSPEVGRNLLEYKQGSNLRLFTVLEDALQIVLLNGKPLSFEHKIVSSDLNLRANFDFTPVMGENNKIVGTFLIIDNISDQKKMENHNKFQRHQLNQIAWSQSHKTRQPVATILGLINIFDNNSLTPDNQKILNMLQETVKKLEVIIQETVVRANSRLDDY